MDSVAAAAAALRAWVAAVALPAWVAAAALHEWVALARLRGWAVAHRAVPRAWAAAPGLVPDRSADPAPGASMAADEEQDRSGRAGVRGPAGPAPVPDGTVLGRAGSEPGGPGKPHRAVWPRDRLARGKWVPDVWDRIRFGPDKLDPDKLDLDKPDPGKRGLGRRGPGKPGRDRFGRDRSDPGRSRRDV